MQVAPIKPTSKAPGTQRSNLNYDKLLSILLEICFQIQHAPLRPGCWTGQRRVAHAVLLHTQRVREVLRALLRFENIERSGQELEGSQDDGRGWAVQVEPMKPMVKAPETKRYNIIYDEPPLNLASEFSLRRYTAGQLLAQPSVVHRPAAHGGGLLAFYRDRAAEHVYTAGAYTRPPVSST